MSSSKTTTPTTTKTTFPYYATVAAAAASSFALGCLASSSSSSGGTIQKYWRKYNRTENYPIWIGSLWFLVSRQRESIWQLASDVLCLGLLLTSSQQNTENSVDSTDTSKSSVDDKDRSFIPRQLRSPSNKDASASSSSSSSPIINNSKSMTTTASSPPSATVAAVDANKSSPQRYLELLVHNVSHTDLVLSAEPPSPPTNSASSASKLDNNDDDSSTDEPQDLYCLCRPRFSAFDEYSRRILEYIDDHENSYDGNDSTNDKLISFPRHERKRSEDISQTRQTSMYQSTLRGDQKKLPIGFRLLSSTSTASTSTKNDNDERLLTVTPEEKSDLRFRGRDAKRVVVGDDPLRLNAVFFPLLATLMPLWHSRIEEKYALKQQQQNQNQKSNNNIKKVLILVSGVGSPRNWTHSVNGNSTDKCAKLMKRFLKTVYPDLVVVQVHSETNIFRYDENITFVKQELMPTIQSYRDAHAKGLPYPDEEKTKQQHPTTSNRSFSTEWGKSMKVTLSFADGSPARNHAIQAALRPYRPTYYHCWQLKTFWHESKIVQSDIEVHSFQEMETLPPIETTQLQDRPVVSEVVEEMKRFRNEVINILIKGDNDIRKFWLRKSRKPVLAVLAVQMPNGKMKLYRGTNMEVSMPTGSLCAERNVIGSALAENPWLKREDLKLIAVLSVPTNAETSGNLSRVASTASFGGGHNEDVVESAPALPPVAPAPTAAASSSSSIMSIFKSRPSSEATTSNDGTSTASKQKPKKTDAQQQQQQDGDWILQDVTSALPFLASSTPPVTSAGEGGNNPSSLDLGAASPSTPGRLLSLYANNRMKQKRTIVVHSHEDLNPLRPCGACNEWLKKIAESNPYFEILTFTDAEMNGVYCTPCEE